MRVSSVQTSVGAMDIVGFVYIDNCTLISVAYIDISQFHMEDILNKQIQLMALPCPIYSIDSVTVSVI